MINTDKDRPFFINMVLRLIGKVTDFQFYDKAAAITYYILLSIGPFMMLLFSLVSYVLADNMDVVISFLSGVIEGSDIVLDPVLDYVSESNSAVFTIIGIGGALFSASKAAKRIIMYLEEIFGLERRSGIRSFVTTYVTAIFSTLALALVLITFIFFVTGDPIAQLVNKFFSFNLNRLFLWRFMKNFFPIIFLMVIVFFMFRALSKGGENNQERVSFFEALLGSGFVALGWFVGSIGYSIYINNFSSSNAIYGALGSIMVMMLWFYFLIFMLLLGAGLIVAYREEKESSGTPALEKNFRKNKN